MGWRAPAQSQGQGMRAAMRRWGVIAAAALVLAGCAAQPLYAPSYLQPNLQAALNAIAIAPVEDFVAQEVRNALLTQFGGAVPQGLPTYELTLRVTSGGGFAVSGPDDPRRGVSVRAAFTLKEIATERILITSNATSTTSYTVTRPLQAFANVRAERDAQIRAAGGVAEIIRTRLALLLSGAPLPAAATAPQGPLPALPPAVPLDDDGPGF